MLILEKHTILVDELHTISIDELRESKQLSVRASNCCYNGRLFTLFEIIQYYQKHNSFLNIRNTGRKSSQELEEFCKKIIPTIDYNSFQTEDGIEDNALEEEQEAINQNAIKEYIQNNLIKAIEEKTVNPSDFFNYVSSDKINFIKNQYISLLPKYSIRVVNRLREVGYQEFVEKYLFNYDEALLDLKHIGRKSYAELIDFKEKFKNEVFKTSEMSKDDYEIEIFLKEHSEIVKDEFIYNFYFENKYIPMFLILEKEYISKKEHKDFDIFLCSYPIFNNIEILSLEKIGKKHNITRERARQIRNLIFEKKINLKEDINKKLKNWDYYKTYLENEKIIWSDDYTILELVKKENCSLSIPFVFFLLAEVCKVSHSFFGDFFSKEKKWNNCVLIHKAYTDIYDFDKLYDDFDALISNNDTEFLLDIENYILNSLYWIDFKVDKINDIILITRDILLFEFGLYSEEDGRIEVPANKEKNPTDVVYEILKQHNKPMHLDEIFSNFKQIMPSHHYEQPSQLRAILQKHDKISYRNRKSVYTLIEWKHIKSGTIRDCIKEFLAMKEHPQTAENITKYVLKYFPNTNISSVRTSMFIASDGQFVYYNNKFFGLKGKKYPSQFTVTEPNQFIRKTFEQRLLDLERFIIDNEHFPFSTSKDSEEASLNRWWNRIISGVQDISDSQQKEVLRIKEQYKLFDVDSDTYNWNQNCNKCKNFLKDNNRQPQSVGVEKTFYGWLRRAKDDFLNNRLNDDQRIKYIEIVKLM